MRKMIFGLIFGVMLVSCIPIVFAQSALLDIYDNSDILVLVKTRSGNLLIEFFPDDAPNHVENFITLADSGFYNEVIFHRIIKDFMIQGGDPLAKFVNIQTNANPDGVYGGEIQAPKSQWGTGGPDHSIDGEFNTLKHNRGMISMARSQDPNSAGSQFFIVHKDSNFLDGQYTVFGRIVGEESFGTLDRIANLTTEDNDRPKNPHQTRIVGVDILARPLMLDSLPTLPEPERTSTSSATTSGTNTDQVLQNHYRSERLGVEFDVPSGWSLQEPPKTSNNSPDVVALGPTTGTIPMALSLTIRDTDGMTFKEVIEVKMENLKPVIENEALIIMSRSVSKINDRDSFNLIAEGGFTQGDRKIDVVFLETMIYDSKKQYTFAIATDDMTIIDVASQHLSNTAESLKILSQDTTSVTITQQPSTDEEGGGCLIATAAYGSEMAPQVQFLRELRDNTVLQTQVGTNFMTGFNQFYYSFSPAVADYERENPMFKEAVKLTLTPLLTSLAILNYVDIDTEQEMLGYGIGVILLNIGMYFVAPAAVIIAIKSRIKHRSKPFSI